MCDIHRRPDGFEDLHSRKIQHCLELAAGRAVEGDISLARISPPGQ
jgi:hypothetical protein